MDLKTDRQVSLIVSSFRKVFEQNNISRLTGCAYKFIMLSYGFIAHYDRHGFMNRYNDVYEFASDIVKHQRMNQWKNFRIGEANYEYYMQKREIYNKIAEMAKCFVEDNHDSWVEIV